MIWGPLSIDSIYQEAVYLSSHTIFYVATRLIVITFSPDCSVVTLGVSRRGDMYV